MLCIDKVIEHANCKAVKSTVTAFLELKIPLSVHVTLNFTEMRINNTLPE